MQGKHLQLIVLEEDGCLLGPQKVYKYGGHDAENARAPHGDLAVEEWLLGSKAKKKKNQALDKRGPPERGEGSVEDHTKPAPGVMATRPATAPSQKKRIVMFWNRNAFSCAVVKTGRAKRCGLLAAPSDKARGIDCVPAYRPWVPRICLAPNL